MKIREAFDALDYMKGQLERNKVKVDQMYEELSNSAKTVKEYNEGLIPIIKLVEENNAMVDDYRALLHTLRKGSNKL